MRKGSSAVMEKDACYLGLTHLISVLLTMFDHFISSCCMGVAKIHVGKKLSMTNLILAPCFRPVSPWQRVHGRAEGRAHGTEDEEWREEEEGRGRERKGKGQHKTLTLRPGLSAS